MYLVTSSRLERSQYYCEKVFKDFIIEADFEWEKIHNPMLHATFKQTYFYLFTVHSFDEGLNF